MNSVELRAVSKAYGRTAVLDNITLPIADNATTAILGPSGSGKTTLLRLIAGFDRPQHGTIYIGDRIVDGPSVHVRPENRGIGYVPQDGALFPHLSTSRNIGFGLRRGDRARVSELIDLVGLSGLADRYPHQLSGGQQQRVALARALAIRPRLVLLDEPFSSLDAGLRMSLGHDVVSVLAKTRTPAILVTHDQNEALSLADRIVILGGGRVLAHGSPDELYRAPASPTTAAYLGEANLLSADVLAGIAHCTFGALKLCVQSAVPDGSATILIRPEQLSLATEPDAGAVPATISSLDYHGHDSVAQLTLDDATTSTARVHGHHDLHTGDRVWMRINSDVIGWARNAP